MGSPDKRFSARDAGLGSAHMHIAHCICSPAPVVSFAIIIIYYNYNYYYFSSAAFLLLLFIVLLLLLFVSLPQVIPRFGVVTPNSSSTSP